MRKGDNDIDEDGALIKSDNQVIVPLPPFSAPSLLLHRLLA